jgi:hypothetical protein
MLFRRDFGSLPIQDTEPFTWPHWLTLLILWAFSATRAPTTRAPKANCQGSENSFRRNCEPQLGRTKADFRLWQDQAAIAHGELWENKIKSAVAESVFSFRLLRLPQSEAANANLSLIHFSREKKNLGATTLFFLFFIFQFQRWRTTDDDMKTNCCPLFIAASTRTCVICGTSTHFQARLLL